MNPILQLRKRLKVSQHDLGAAIGVTQSAVSQFEKGISIPSPETVRRLIEFSKTKGIAVSFESIYTPNGNGLIDRMAASDDAQPPIGRVARTDKLPKMAA